MNDTQRELLADIVALTGNAMPDWTQDDSPTLRAEAVDARLYFIGVIGGKDVGKSSLINNLLGETVARVTAYGEGTARALAYMHEEDAAAVRSRLSAEVPEAFDVVTHRIDTARGRVLLDLPDIDSVWSQHVELTRRLLRVMLYPVWVQSIEKYADQQPLQLLAKVSAGNSPENFLFVLTKVDQLAARHGEAAVKELSDDYAARIARTSGGAAKVFAVSNPQPEAYDFLRLRELVLATRGEVAVTRSKQLALQQQQKTFGAWVDQQQIAPRLAAAERMLEDAETLTAQRLAEPVVDQLTNRLATEAGVRATLIEPVVRERLSYWPIVNVIDAVAGPVVSGLRGVGASASGETLAGRDIAQHVRGVFAELTQRYPQMLTLYENRKLWEADSAQFAAGLMQQRLGTALSQQRAALTERLAKPPALVRFLSPFITVGAALWFPIVQPTLQIFLQDGIVNLTRESALLVVKLLSADALIKSVGILAIYYVALWMWLRWLAQKRIDRALRKSTDTDHPAASILAWTDELLGPLRRHVERLRQLQRRIDDFKQLAATAA